MPTALEDIRARVDRGLDRAPVDAPDDVPTLDSLKARVDRALGRESPESIAATSEVPVLESLRARIQAAKGLPPVPRRRPEVPGITALDQGPDEPEVPIPQRKPEIRRLRPGEFIQNPDGSRSTERSITVTEQAINQGRPTNIPSLYSIGGEFREVPQEQALRFALATGEQYPSFDTIEEAIQAAQARSAAGGRMADAVPPIEPAPEVPFSEQLSPSDRASPISDSIIAEGLAAIQAAEADQAANEILRRNGPNGRPVGDATAPAPIPDPINPNGQGLARSALHAIPQGVAGGVAGFPEQVGIAAQRRPRWLLEQYSRIDREEPPQSRQEAHDWATTPEIVFYSKAAPEARRRLRDEAGAAIRPIAEEPAFQVGQRIRESTAEAFPVAPEHEGRFPVQLGRGIGSTATFLGTGLAGRLLRLPALPVIAGTGAIANSSETFRDAIDKGASFEDAYQASRIAGVVGTSEAVPIVKMLDRLDDASGGQIRRLVIRAAQGGLEEGAQELFQSVAENLIASELVAYDPERGLFQGSGDAAGVGFTVGALMNFLASMLGAKMRHSPRQVTKQTVREFTEHVVREGEGLPTPPGRPAERGEPFTRPEAPAAPGAPTGESPAAPDEPAVVRPGEDIGGRPIPPGPEAPPAILPDDIPRTVFRGSGRTEQGEAYSGPAVPILGPGRYYAFSREAAKKFGPNVEEADFAPKNPLVIRSDEEWKALTKEAGWKFPNPFGQSAEVVALQTEALQDVLRQRGHDAVVVYWDDTTQTDTDRFGNEVKTLRTVFGEPQAFQLDKARTITAPPPPEGPTFPREEPGGVKPKPSRRVPRTPAALESLLNEWDRLRHARGVSPERKAEAQRLQQDAIARLEGVKQQVQQAEQEGRAVEGPVEFRLRTASGAETTFQLEPDVEAIEGIQKRLAGTKAEGKFFSRAPAGTAGLIVPEVEGATTGVERAIDTEHGTARIAFPDELHERLFDLAEGRPDKAEARALYDELKGYVLERFTGPADVIALAREYREEVLDQAQTAARYRGGKLESAGLVIDPEEQARYLQRPTLENLRARVDRALGRQPESVLPETAFAGTPEPAPGGAVPDTTVPSLDDLRQRVRAGVQGSAGAGAAYQGFVQDQVEGVAAPAGKPLRREDILRPLLKDLGVPLYQGRIKSKRFLGFYRRKIEEVRIKRMGDIEVAAHEIAHMLDDRFPEIRHQWLPPSNANKEIREELRGVSYDRTKLFEGFAEFVRLWSTQREEAKARAPKFYGWFEDFVARNKHGPALRKAQEGMHAWFAQDAVSRARSKIGVTKEINAGLTRPFDKFRQAVADDLHGIYRMERELTGVINPAGSYEIARLTRAKHSMIEGTLLYGAPIVKPDGSHGFEGKGLSQILDPVASQLDDFLMYAVGRSARELMSQGREHLFTPAEVKGMVALETPEFRQAFAEYQIWYSAILDFAEAKGVINPFFRATWKRAQYLPFHRVGQPGAFSPVPGDWKGIRALTGGTDNLRDILGNMIGNASMLIDAALTNEARLEVANLARQRGGAHFMAKIPKEERIIKVHREEIERAILDALGVEKKAQLPIEKQKFIDQIVNGMGAMVPLIQRGQTPYGNNVVAVLQEGSPEFYEVADPLLYSALTHLNRPAQHWVIRVLSVPKRIGQASITLAVDFLLANVARDTLSGWVMSRHGFKPIVDSARGMASRIKSDPNYRGFIANGGGFSSYLRDETAFRTHLEKFYDKKGIDYRTVLDAPSKMLFALERFADAFEMSTRLGEYRQAIQAGEQPRHAAFSAREVSTDFAMRGDWAPIGYAYDTIIFLKAAMNGMDRLYRGVAHDPNRVQIAAKSGLIALASMGLLALNRGNPLYDDLEDWDKDTHWHFFIPKIETLQAWADRRPLPPLKDRYNHFRYPKIWEIGGMASLAERSLERTLDGQPEKIGEDAWRILRDVFRFEYLPAAVAPLYEIAINRNRFLDRSIESQAMRELQPWARSRPGGSRTLRALGEAERTLPTKFQASPAQVEALLRGYFHTWASYGLTLSDAAFFDDVPSLRIDQYPVLRRFYQRTPPRHTKYVTQLYDALAEATAARRTMRHMDRTFRPDFAKEIEDTPENLEYGQLTRAQKGMRGISAEMRFVVITPDLPTLQRHAVDLAREMSLRPKINRLRRSKAWGDLGDLKRELLDLWTEERNTLAKAVMQDIEAQRKQRRKAR